MFGSVNKPFPQTRENKGTPDRGKSVYKGKVTCHNRVHGRNYNQVELKCGAHGEVLLSSHGHGSGSVRNCGELTVSSQGPQGCKLAGWQAFISLGEQLGERFTPTVPLESKKQLKLQAESN